MPVTCRLSTILGSRRLKMADVVRGTGLAKNTVLALYHDRVRKVDYEVLGKLCRFLNCQPGDLLVYVPDEEQKGEGR
jgi:putative transcriptional regulator